MEKLLLGNEAIARGIVECSVEVVTSYPGTPSSEILPAVADFYKEEGIDANVEWCVNEKVAFEIAATVSFAGKRAAVAMKQVGLNVAFDPFMSVAYNDIAAGFLVISADDPGPHSSQTEQDSRFAAMMAKVPVYDPSSPREAKEMVKFAYDFSEKYNILVMLRPGLRVCHARQNVPVEKIDFKRRQGNFLKNPQRWVCLPAVRRKHHERLNEKMKEISKEKDPFSRIENPKRAGLGIIASGVSYSVVKDIIDRHHIDVPLLKIGRAFPVDERIIEEFLSLCDKVLVFEETYPVVEVQLPERERVLGKWNGIVPAAGELTPEVIASVLSKFFKIDFLKVPEGYNEVLSSLGISVRRPILCAGCPHRAAFFAMRKAFPDGVYPSDIGCYTLGINQKAVDSVMCMGGAVTMGSGFSIALGDNVPVVSTIGDSTFYHMGVPGLINAVYNKHRFILFILDNHVTAMTGGQPTPESGVNVMKDGERVDLIKLVEGCGVKFVKTVDPYNIVETIELLKEAWNYVKKEGKVAVVISKHPCKLLERKRYDKKIYVDEGKCVGCRYCISEFGCPGLGFNSDKRKAFIDLRFCINCGVCTQICPVKAIKEE
ncbi:MAG: indolepyruvate ferredoxin oxidoreductase subunit alpha [Synergistetes bacterium]|nr:indolepyruvate ferredoxin oxidoreductase subunit alpha [Synergistota bacterium]MCX8127872.1 indolepyruvate ferredoxin oxidoreductase subunit alpha [Synergistota bacterium]MDW8192134.1 indolepyruvate ferredoxin oxidoreductase subunit alpha [Synergistota bacterium]